MTSEPEFTSPQAAANDPRILLFGRLLGAANGFEYLLAHTLADSAQLTHAMFELLLIVGRAGPDGASVRDIAQARVLTSGGATRLVHRAIEQGLVSRRPSPDDGRVQLVGLTPEGERVLLDAAASHARGIRQLLIDAIPPEDLAAFERTLKVLSKTAAALLPVMP